MSDIVRNPTPPPYGGTTLEQLEQIVEGPVWDGNLISKTSRDRLMRDACIVKDEDARDPKGPADVGAWVSTKKGRLIAFVYGEDEGRRLRPPFPMIRRAIAAGLNSLFGDRGWLWPTSSRWKP